MIAKCIKGKGFKGAVAYDLQKDKSVLLETNMAAGQSQKTQDFAREFGVIRALRPSLTKAVCHVSISLHPDERLDDDTWCKVGQAWLEGMGFTDNQYLISRHTDTQHPHIHILVNRITLDGSVVSDAYDYKRQEGIMRSLEKKYGLVQVPNSKDVGKKALTKGEVEQILRTQEPSVRMKIQEKIDAVLVTGTKDFALFRKALKAHYIDTKLNQASTGTVSGISFALEGIAFKGSKLGKAYTLKSLQKRGLMYENGHDTQHQRQERAINTSRQTGSTPLERTGTLGNAGGLAQSTRESEIAKQCRIIENFERLEAEHRQCSKGDTKKHSRGAELSR
ncbi:MAG: relaxase/mobilization nuclease domain-containing protein [Desulfovibrionaceae bacterium]|nr:relaxase/mobilization nuclease domain-containing protein [Desulfovibrionaceae bacterium]